MRRAIIQLLQCSYSSLVRSYLKHIGICHILILVLSVVIVYWPVYQFDFLYGWDDQWFVTNFYTEDGLRYHNIYAIFTTFYYGQYAPMNQLYYTLLYSIVRYDSGYYHIADVCIHLVNVILVYLLINTLGLRFLNSSSIRIKQISFFTALLFAILPINIEPVAWVAASKVLLYTLFYLIALICYCKYLADFRSLYFYLTLLFFAFSFGAKEQAVILPVCLVLFDYIYGRKFINRMIWLEKVPFFLLSLLFGLVTIQSQGIQEGGRIFYPIYQRIPLAFYTLSEYFTKCLIPINLSYLYPYPFQVGEQVPWWLWIYPIVIPVIIYCFYKQMRHKWTLFGVLFFLIHIVLVINIITLARFSVIADRYAYLATIGICFMISYLFVKKSHKGKLFFLLRIAGLLYIGALISYSHTHVMVWKNAYSLKERLKNTIENRKDFDILKRLK